MANNAPRAAPQYVIDGPLPPCKGYEQLDTTELTTMAQLTVPNNATIALLQAEAGDIRWRADEVSPTASIGMLIAEGGEVLYVASNDALADLRFIRATAGAILNVSYY